ncbi:hypothetical protein GUJ93_ZPchr0015g6718 [Zizania palustris]|uniref:Uncharacterized protein n=1 Tax=Zizania palustris TaxID=103762 RepID=A0A8J5W6Z3_ZIZPA|nr:hypothetical protein GUJ93_ZPchr0015g6718 [Zizania palustris]
MWSPVPALCRMPYQRTLLLAKPSMCSLYRLSTTLLSRLHIAAFPLRALLRVISAQSYSLPKPSQRAEVAVMSSFYLPDACASVAPGLPCCSSHTHMRLEMRPWEGETTG